MEETIFGLSNEDYHRGEMYKDYISSSQLKDYEVSPKFAKFKKDNPDYFQIGKDAREKGSLYHNCLESIVNTGDTKQFEESVMIFDNPINQKTGNPYGYDTKSYQEAYFECQSANLAKELVSQTDLDLIRTMIDQLLNGCGQTSKDIRDLMKWGKAEVSHFVEYEGARFKYRPDLETKKKIVDWKSVAADDLHENTINKIISKFHYDLSAAFYQYFEHQRTGIWKEFYWVFQQKTAPYDAIIVSAENWTYLEDDGIVTLGTGALKFRTLLDQHLFCTQNQVWEGAHLFIPKGFRDRRIMTPRPPVFERLFTFYN